MEKKLFYYRSFQTDEQGQPAKDEDGNFLYREGSSIDLSRLVGTEQKDDFVIMITDVIIQQRTPVEPIFKRNNGQRVLSGYKYENLMSPMTSTLVHPEDIAKFYELTK